ncbi:hypothetical protein SAMN04489867_3594 [Pedococcus dokdonensis]|uniref:Glyoxalase-like domain-containing protein n=1 Tax=Pedococcus dokdonensis TaxID=443156 RepID=A0A1H0V0J3_9MICO|nr:VOC family protein [Pedococcus dokdonensis]SDP71854.1 hypothetical protein SAMN04489867_3594 [Pedococcus dokdonensis]
MRIRWVWAFLDLAEQGFDEEIEFWPSATATVLSPWRGERAEFATLLPADGSAWLKVQRVGGGGGIHLDLDVAEPLESARDEAVGLGAEVLAEVPDDDGVLGVVVCRSPGGLVFCLTRWQPHETAAGQVRSDARTLLDQVCLDVPGSGYAAEVAFWSALTGWEARAGSVPGFTSLLRPPGIPVRLLLQQRQDDEGPVRAHVDFACLDRAEETERHVALGAEVERVERVWTVLVSPSGRRYCLTDRDPLTGTVRG